ncbi:hypothetical protein GCM10010495_73760 [Kitasatospora herbaricolor]|nr:hypothetical protein GCM10010495_73760 [Kitasatospora herbaricolor]
MLPAGTEADHTSLEPTCVHPVIWEAPEITGRAPGAAFQTTGWPAEPESAAPKDQVVDGRYVPLLSSTVTSVELSAASSDRTAPCAPCSEHGDDAEHVEPAPDGEA